MTIKHKSEITQLGSGPSATPAAGGAPGAEGVGAPSASQIADRIAKLVELVGGQGKAADIAQASRAAIQKWRTNNARPPLIEMHLLAKAAGVSLEWIVTGEATPRDRLVHHHEELANIEAQIAAIRRRLAEFAP